MSEIVATVTHKQQDSRSLVSQWLADYEDGVPAQPTAERKTGRQARRERLGLGAQAPTGKKFTTNKNADFKAAARLEMRMRYAADAKAKAARDQALNPPTDDGSDIEERDTKSVGKKRKHVDVMSQYLGRRKK